MVQVLKFLNRQLNPFYKPPVTKNDNNTTQQQPQQQNIIEQTKNEIYTMYYTIKNMNRRQLLHQLLTLLLIVSTAIIIWKSLILYTNCESPVVVVLSGSMEPAFYRGDILFLNYHTDTQPLDIGDIVVFKIKGRDIPIVHRIHELHTYTNSNNTVMHDILTKGDNNPIHDRGLYNVGQLWLNQDDISGRAVGYLPYLGMVTILLTDYPLLKYAVIGIMGLFVITTKE